MNEPTLRIQAHLTRRARWRRLEIAFWLALVALIFALPSRALLINEFLIAGLFALSLDLILGYAGLISLGHAAFLGIGAYAAGILASRGVADPLVGLALASLAAGLAGLITAPLLLRGSDLTRLMVTLGVCLMLGELANRNSWATGGSDGLNFSVAPVFGRFPIDFTGQRNAALYSLAVLFVLFVAARRLVQSRRSACRCARSRKTACAPGRSAYPVAPPHCDLHGRRGLCRRGRRAARPDHPDRLARRVRFPPLGRCDADAGDRRPRLSLWRPAGFGLFIVLRDGLSTMTPEFWEFWIGLLLVVLVLVGRERIGEKIAGLARRLLARGAS